MEPAIHCVYRPWQCGSVAVLARPTNEWSRVVVWCGVVGWGGALAAATTGIHGLRGKRCIAVIYDGTHTELFWVMLGITSSWLLANTYIKD